MTRKKLGKKVMKWNRLSKSRLVFLSLYLIFIFSFIFYHLYFAKRIIPGVYVNQIYLGGKTVEDSVKILNDELHLIDSVKIKAGENYETDVMPVDLGLEILYVETAKNAFKVGRSGSLLNDINQKWSGMSGITKVFGAINLSPVYKYDEGKLQSLIGSIKQSALNIVAEPSFRYENGALTIYQGHGGQAIDNTMLEKSLIDAFVIGGSATVIAEIFDISPVFTVSDLDLVKVQMGEIVETKYVLFADKKSWVLTSDEVLSTVVPVKLGENISLGINEVRLLDKLEKIALELDKNPRGQILKVENSRAVEFVSSQNGIKLKIKESADLVKKGLLDKTPDIELSVQITNPPESENKFGVKEIIGIGKSGFKGSIRGRVHNIGLASSRVSGVLVPPGEIFSFNEAVGEVSGKTGYTSAYIISKGRTILGDGGGVCQVSTTLFRAALKAGLPIVERNAHSYRVSYYEQDSPVGIDATIYIPSVDLRFRNDTPGYILISSEFDEKNSTLEFVIYGTNDGREVKITEPKVLSKTPPPNPVYESDPALKKGTKVQVEYAVWGASVVFERTVTRAGETLSYDTFKSNYRPWRAVYKVGTKE